METTKDSSTEQRQIKYGKAYLKRLQGFVAEIKSRESDNSNYYLEWTLSFAYEKCSL